MLSSWQGYTIGEHQDNAILAKTGMGICGWRVHLLRRNNGQPGYVQSLFRLEI